MAWKFPQSFDRYLFRKDYNIWVIMFLLRRNGYVSSQVGINYKIIQTLKPLISTEICKQFAGVVNYLSRYGYILCIVYCVFCIFVYFVQSCRECCALSMIWLGNVDHVCRQMYIRMPLGTLKRVIQPPVLHLLDNRDTSKWIQIHVILQWVVFFYHI